MENPKATKKTSRSFFNADSLSPATSMQHAKDQVEDFLGAIPEGCMVDITSMVVLENGAQKPGATHVFSILIIARVPEEEGKQ